MVKGFLSRTYIQCIYSCPWNTPHEYDKYSVFNFGWHKNVLTCRLSSVSPRFWLLKHKCFWEQWYMFLAPDSSILVHDDVVKWKHFFRVIGPLCGEFTGHPPVTSPRKGQWRGALMSSLIYALTNGWVNNRDAHDLRRHRAHYDVTVMWCFKLVINYKKSTHYITQ